MHTTLSLGGDHQLDEITRLLLYEAMLKSPISVRPCSGRQTSAPMTTTQQALIL